MAGIRIQRQTGRREPTPMHRISVPLEAGLANVVRRHVAAGISPVDFRAHPKTSRRRKPNSLLARA